jgi:hypothetical protein
MPALDPLALRVARRYLAEVEFARVAVEYQRRPEGLVAVGNEDDDSGEPREVDDTRHAQ